MIHVIENGTIPDLRPNEVAHALELIQQFQVLPPIMSVEQDRVVQERQAAAMEQQRQDAQQRAQQLHEELSLHHFIKKPKNI